MSNVTIRTIGDTTVATTEQGGTQHIDAHVPGKGYLNWYLPSPPPLWGFFHTTCNYESAAALISLHHTKAGAWRAMRQAQWDAWEEIRSRQIRGWRQHRERGEKAYVHQRSHVRAVEVLP